MLSLSNLPKMTSLKKEKRIGRGNAGKGGTTGGRGQKGQKSRSGSSIRIGFRGGETPVYQQVPKLRGKRALVFKKKLFQVINIKDLNKCNDLEVVDINSLIKRRIIRKKNFPVKLLSNGDLEKDSNIKKILINSISSKAKEKLEKRGIKIELLVKEKK